LIPSGSLVEMKNHLLSSRFNNELEMPTSFMSIMFSCYDTFSFFLSSSFLLWVVWLGLGGGVQETGDLVISRDGLFRTGIDSLVRRLTVLPTLLFPGLFFFVCFVPLSFYPLPPFTLPPSPWAHARHPVQYAI